MKATDQAGNTGPAATRSFTVDTTAPDATITAGPTGLTADPSPSFDYSSSEPTGASFQCKLDGPGAATGSFSDCTPSPKQFSGLADGTYTFSVKATDQAGNTGPAATRSFTVDTTAPDTVIDSAPHGTTNDATPSFTFHSTEPGSSFECSLDTGTPDFHPCSSPFTPSALADGDYTFRVRATDAATNTDPSPATEDFTVDTIAPDPPTISGTDPASPANDNSPKVIGTIGGGSPTQVKIYENASCSGSPDATGTVAEFTGAGIQINVSDDSTTLLSAKTSKATGDSGCSNSVSYVEDSTPPDTVITSGPPNSTGSTSATFVFHSTEPGTLECRLDGGAFKDCSSPMDYTGLAVGSHSFEVQSTDLAGNVDSTPASWTWTIAGQVLGQSAQSPTFQLKKKLKVVHRKANAVTVTCPEGTCRVVQAQARLKLQGESVSARIKGPSVIQAGGSAILKVVLSKAANRRLLSVGKGRLFLRLLVTSTNGSQAQLANKAVKVRPRRTR